jgi:small-conductance mechanosensitive channel
MPRPLRLRRKAALAMALAILLLGGSASADAPSAIPDAPGPQEVIAFLHQTVDWHRRLNADEQLAGDPNDVAFLNDARPVADQALRLAFDFARADAQLLATQSTAPDQSAGPVRYQSLSQSAAAADALVKQTQDEVESLQRKLETAQGRQRRALQSQLDETRSELALAQTRSQTLHDILQFVSGGPGGTQGSLLAQVEELQRAVPEAAELPAEAKSGAPAPVAAAALAPPAPRSQPSGLLGLAGDLFTLARKRRALDRTLDATDALAQSSKKLRAPFVARLAAIARQGEELAKQADTSDPTQLEQEKRQLDALTAGFKQASSVVLPLGKQSILLSSYKGSLGRWRAAVQDQYSVELRSLILRLVFLVLMLGLVVALAELWRRATLRYIHDPRRRYQFLLLRRIALWCAIATTIAFSLASELGSLATFAGLITAGIALALQNVILAVAGYFFLIGKYGVRAGDRVQIGDVTGEVVDIGLVRLQLLELAGGGATGRVVAFSNSIVFQPGTSFFKQIPGTSFLRHEVRLTLAPESDYRVAEKRMLRAVETVYADYRERIEQQHRQMERVLDMPVEVPRPQSRLRLTSAGLEVVIRYPVELQNAADIDDRITRELLNALGQTPRLRLVGSGIPNIQPVMDDPGPAKQAS